MSGDRRENYRAPIQDQGGRLEIGRRTWWGSLEDESAGGFGFTTQDTFNIELGAEGKLVGNNRFPSAVRVAYIEASGDSTRIGLQRTEMTRPGSKPEAPEPSFRVPRLTIIAIGVLAGLALGLLIVRQPWAS
jgi:hypothetical protein